MTYWLSAKFKALQNAWYAKLEATGFEDAEVMVNGQMMLRQCAEHPLKEWSSLEVDTRATYYQALGILTETHDFQSIVDRTILTMFAEGAKIRTICEVLEHRGIPSLRQRRRRCRNTVTFTIRKYEQLWGLREYSPRQLNKKVPA